jgi:hypothetical protein
MGRIRRGGRGSRAARHADISIRDGIGAVKAKRSEESRLAGAVVMLLAGGLLARAVVRLPADLPTDVSRWTIPFLTAAGVAAVLSVALREVLTRRALKRRVAVAIVPADEFDPPAEAVARFAAQLSRIRRGPRRWLERPASALRVRLEADPDDRLVYVLEAPGHAKALLRSALRGYHGVQLQSPAALLDSRPQPRGRVVRVELVLARPSIEPLARLDLDPDPLGAFAAALSALRSDRAERAVVCVDLLPASPGERRRLRRRLLRRARHQDHPGALAEPVLEPRRNGRTSPAQLAQRRVAGQAIDAKLKDSGALFRLQVLVACQSTSRARAREAIRCLLGAFDAMAEHNWLRAAGIRLPGLGFLGSDLPLRRRRFDRRLGSGHFRPARRGVVSAREIAAFLKPPTIRCISENVARSGALVPTAPALPDFEGQRELIPLGRVAGEEGERLVGVRAADTFFSYVAGRSRYGKTELAIAQFLHLVRSGHGGLFLDPHEDALARIKPHLTDPGVRERVVEINLAARHTSQPAWNLFELSSADPLEAEGRVEAIVDAFASALRWDERNNRALTLTTQAAQALAALARHLPPALAPTIFQLPTLLSEPDWRVTVLPHLPAASQRFWTERFPRLPEDAITPVTNLIDRLRASTPTSALLGQSQSTYRVRDAMDQGLIVLACPGSGGVRDRLLANLLVFDLLHAAKARADTAPERRRAFFCFLDEVQTYDGAASGNLAALLEQSAKYGIRAFLLNQNPERLTQATLNAVTTNRSHLLATALNARAASLIAREWGGEPDPAALTRLQRFRFLAQVTDRGQLSAPFHLHAPAVEELHGPGRPDQLDALEEALGRHRRPARHALEHLDTLDERILEQLRRTGSGRAEAVGALAIDPPNPT